MQNKRVAFKSEFVQANSTVCQVAAQFVGQNGTCFRLSVIGFDQHVLLYLFSLCDLFHRLQFDLAVTLKGYRMPKVIFNGELEAS